MSVLVLGGTGATGRRVIGELLAHGISVTSIVRSADRLPESLRNRDALRVVVGTVLDLDENELKSHVAASDACVSCLGHALSFAGIFGPPYRLVTRSVERVCALAEQDARPQPMRMVLMNSTGCRAPGERVGLAQRLVVGLIRVLVPPHADNESAARSLRKRETTDSVEWCVVRPDGLIDNDAPSTVELYAEPIRSAIFDSGKTSRANVARFMAELAMGKEEWQEWKGRSPVIYNASDDSEANE